MRKGLGRESATLEYPSRVSTFVPLTDVRSAVAAHLDDEQAEAITEGVGEDGKACGNGESPVWHSRVATEVYIRLVDPASASGLTGAERV